jgi:hypothetical protein
MRLMTAYDRCKAKLRNWGTAVLDQENNDVAYYQRPFGMR